MIEIELLPVENTDENSTKSGDAIVAHFTPPGASAPVVVVIDAGFTPVGNDVADHIAEYYGTSHVDLVISTHPDSDHINGLITLFERCTVGELMMHLPWKHHHLARELGNYEKIEALWKLATDNGVTITEPFTGVNRYNGAVDILGPSMKFYEEMLDKSLEQSVQASAAMPTGTLFGSGRGVATMTKMLERVLTWFPVETLTDIDDTSPRNQSSVITLINVDGYRHMLTGDAGIQALSNAADVYEETYGAFESNPLEFIQAPHHGSHHNVGPTILNRILGTPNSPYGQPSVLISSARLSEKHPSPRVTNAFGRRGGRVYATEGQIIHHSHNAGRRYGWSPMTPVSPLVEDDE